MMRKLINWFLIATLLAPAVYAEKNATQRISDFLDRMDEGVRLNGTILVAGKDQVIYENPFGLANREWSIPNTVDTRFRIGSVTKQFTAALILQLMEEGKIDLEFTISDYLRDYPSKQGNQITVYHLLTHSSGIPNITALPHFREEVSRNPHKPKETLKEFSNLDLEFEPGSKTKYSNSGYLLLGVILEEVTSQTYEDLLKKRILDPLGLENTGYDHYQNILERRASGYARKKGGYERAEYIDTSVPFSAGMLYSTVGDLFKWTRALHSGKVFKNPVTLEQMTSRHIGDSGYGLMIQDITLGELQILSIQHAGGIPGFGSFLMYLPKQEYTIAVLSNGGNNPRRVAMAIAAVLFNQPVEKPTR